MTKKIVLLCAAAFLCAFSFSLAQENQEQLAEVLVLPFANETGKKEYEWLSKNIPAAVVDSMKEKFRFNLLSRDRFEEIVLLSKTKEPVFFRAHTDEKEIVKISKVVNADIIIYGKYAYNKADKTIAVNAFIYHRSRGKTTGNIDMDTPVTSEMFKLVDKVADSVIEHIALVAQEDAKAAKKAGETIAQEEKKAAANDDKIALVRREMKSDGSYRFYAGAAFVGCGGYFTEVTKPGPSVSIGITNNESRFWHYGLSFSALQLGHSDNDNEDNTSNIIEWMLFMPLTIQGGINIKTDFFTFFQPFLGIGVSFDAMGVGDEKIFFDQLPAREDTGKIHWYINPTATAGIRMPIALGTFFIAPFAQVHVYTGTTSENERKYGFPISFGVSVFW